MLGQGQHVQHLQQIAPQHRVGLRLCHRADPAGHLHTGLRSSRACPLVSLNTLSNAGSQHKEATSIWALAAKMEAPAAPAVRQAK